MRTRRLSEDPGFPRLPLTAHRSLLEILSEEIQDLLPRLLRLVGVVAPAAGLEESVAGAGIAVGLERLAVALHLLHDHRELTVDPGVGLAVDAEDLAVD